MSNSDTQGLEKLIRNWIHMDTLAASHELQAQNARRVQRGHETQIIEQMTRTGMRNTLIEVPGGTVRIAKRSNHISPVQPVERIVGAWAERNHISQKHTVELVRLLRGHIVIEEYLKKEPVPSNKTEGPKHI